MCDDFGGDPTGGSGHLGILFGSFLYRLVKIEMKRSDRGSFEAMRHDSMTRRTMNSCALPTSSPLRAP
jgi:hypothetical protein